ncbi:MAG: hypothetical protein GC185_10680 [Alphaproteobacteria bacterium]|nr:hypothetical protein [Alphaproteobacteria bacterium]
MNDAAEKGVTEDAAAKASAAEHPFAGIDVSELTLFHGMRTPLEGDALLPVNERDINGKKAKYLFATPYVAKSLMFAFDWRKEEAIVGGPVRGSADQFIIVCERERTMKKDIDLYLYSFNGGGHGFEKTTSGQAYLKGKSDKNYDTREFATEKAVPASALGEPRRIRSLDEVMQGGLQIFSTARSRQELLAEGFLDQKYMDMPPAQWLFKLLGDGFVWENDARGVNPNPLLKKSFEKLSARVQHPRPEGGL